LEPEIRKIASEAAISTLTVLVRAFFIWLDTKRSQMME
jgi:hypothetical protein